MTTIAIKLSDLGTYYFNNDHSGQRAKTARCFENLSQAILQRHLARYQQLKAHRIQLNYDLLTVSEPNLQMAQQTINNFLDYLAAIFVAI